MPTLSRSKATKAGQTKEQGNSADGTQLRAFTQSVGAYAQDREMDETPKPTNTSDSR